MEVSQGVYLVGEAAQSYVALQWYKFYVSIVALVFLVAFILWVCVKLGKS